MGINDEEPSYHELLSFLAEMLQEETQCQLVKTDLLDEDNSDD